MDFIDQLKDLKKQVKFQGDFGKLSGFRNIVISGMGGSGIAGSIFSELYRKCPVEVVTDYHLPEYAGSDTLFIGISYSGNTEETLSAAGEAIRNGCQVRLVTSGGQLSEMGQDTVLIPPGLQPRSALGYLLKPFLSTFITSSEEEYAEISGILQELDNDNKAQEELATEISGRQEIPVVMGYEPLRWVAYRWKTQFNENSKLLSFSNYFPELNHNETVPLRSSYRKDVFRFLVFGGAPQRIEERIRITSRITGTDFTRIPVVGNTLLQRLFYLIHYGDYLSYHLARARNLDPEEVGVIEELKKELKK